MRCWKWLGSNAATTRGDFDWLIKPAKALASSNACMRCGFRASVPPSLANTVSTLPKRSRCTFSRLGRSPGLPPRTVSKMGGDFSFNCRAMAQARASSARLRTKVSSAISSGRSSISPTGTIFRLAKDSRIPFTCPAVNRIGSVSQPGRHTSSTPP